MHVYKDIEKHKHCVYRDCCKYLRYLLRMYSGIIIVPPIVASLKSTLPLYNELMACMLPFSFTIYLLHFYLLMVAHLNSVNNELRLCPKTNAL